MNWATEYSDEVETRSEARQHRRQSRAQERAKKKALAERDYLFREWQKWRKGRRKELLAGPHAQHVQKLADFLERMKLSDEPALIDTVKRGPWQQADRDTKFLILDLISRDIVYLREKAGLEPFDDPLPDDKPDAFQIIKEMLK